MRAFIFILYSSISPCIKKYKEISDNHKTTSASWFLAVVVEFLFIFQSIEFTQTKHTQRLLLNVTIIWLKYCRYIVRHSSINWSINLNINARIQLQTLVTGSWILQCFDSSCVNQSGRPSSLNMNLWRKHKMHERKTVNVQFVAEWSKELTLYIGHALPVVASLDYLPFAFPGLNHLWTNSHAHSI